MNLIFDPEKHAYFLDGKELPSVTQVIKGAGLMPMYNKGDGVTPQMEYGTKVHKAVADIIANKNPSLESFVGIAVEGFLAWRDLYRPTIPMSEIPGASERYQYAGTLDIGCIINKKRWLIDVKTGDYCPWHIIQLAAYNEIFKDQKAQKFGGLYLDPVIPGKYVFKEISHAEISAGFAVFYNALQVMKWKKNNGI